MAIRLAKEVHELDRKLRSLTRDQGELIESDIEDGGRWIIVRLTPNAGYYEGGSFDFKIEFPDSYPEWMPAVTCLTYIYHPNIDPTTQQCPNVCLNILEADNWCEGFGLQGCIIGLLFLLHNPNFDDLINPLFEIRETEAEYREDIRKSMNGEKVGFLTGVLDEVFTMFIPKMISIFDKDTSMRSAPLDESDHGNMNVAINDSGEKSTDDCDCDTDVMNDVTNGSGTGNKLLDICNGDFNVAKTAGIAHERMSIDNSDNEPKNKATGSGREYTLPDGHEDTVNVAKDLCLDQTSRSPGENVTHTGLYEHLETSSEQESKVNINQQTYDTNATVNRSLSTTTLKDSHADSLLHLYARENERASHSKTVGVMRAERCNSNTGVMENSDAVDYSRLESIDYDELLYQHFMDID